MRRLAAPAAEGVRVLRFSLGGQRFAVIVDGLAAAALPRSVTPSEREVASLLGRGLSNRAIAQARGTSLRTVANQISSLMQKVGADSRVQLALRMSGNPPRSSPATK